MEDQPVVLVPIEDILVEDRFRSELEGPDGNQKIAFLAESISKYGLLNPITLDRAKNRLLAGGRRLAAMKLLNWTLAPVLYRDQLTDLQQKEIELEENIARKDMTPVERADLVAAIDQLKRQIYGSRQSGAVYQKAEDGGTVRVETASLPPDEDAWSLRRTADLMGTSVFSTHRDIVISNTVKVLPSLRTEKSAANILRKAEHLIEDLERELDFRQQQASGIQLDSNILLGDAIDLIKTIPNASVDCIITDPPYGLGLEKGRFAARDSTDTGFTDDQDTVLGVLDALVPELRRVLKPSGHLYAFFGASVWSDTICVYQQAGFNVSPIVCIWYKLGPATGAGDWDHSFAPAWEPFLFCTDRTRRLAYKHKNVFEAEAPSGPERLHPTQKPLKLLEELVLLSTDPGDLVLDPFAGSGSTLVAAKSQGRRYLGFELNERYVEITKQRLL